MVQGQIERQRADAQRRTELDRRARINDAVAWFGEERRQRPRRLTAQLVDWKARFDAARFAA